MTIEVLHFLNFTNSISLTHVSLRIFVYSSLIQFDLIQKFFLSSKYLWQPKSLCRSLAGRHFYGTENVVWATFKDCFIMFLGAKRNLKKNLENVLASALKSCIIPIWEIAPENMKETSQIGLNSQSIVYCSIGDTSLRDFYIMTLVTTELFKVHT